MLKQNFIIILFFAGNMCLRAQTAQTIVLDNPSFEDYPGAAHTPFGWFNCGFTGETDVDVQPGSFQVMRPAQNGRTYMGMVTRDVNTWESVGQKLKTPILKGIKYNFSFYAARSELYVSQSQLTHKDVNYITPAIVRVWGGNSACGKDELLAETPQVSAAEWQHFNLSCKTKANYDFIVVEAFYKVPTLFPYNGNILIDNFSEIKPDIPAKVPPRIAQAQKPVTRVPPARPIEKPKDVVTTDVHPTKPATNKPVITPDPPKPVERTALKEGQTITIEKLQFSSQSAEISSESFQSLDKIYEILNTNQNLIVEIGGHTNLIIADEVGIGLSLKRANAVAEYLVNKGIDRKRLQTKGYGGTKPIMNETTAAANKVNQRVEVKIISVNG